MATVQPVKMMSKFWHRTCRLPRNRRFFTALRAASRPERNECAAKRFDASCCRCERRGPVRNGRPRAALLRSEAESPSIKSFSLPPVRLRPWRAALLRRHFHGRVRRGNEPLGVKTGMIFRLSGIVTANNRRNDQSLVEYLASLHAATTNSQKCQNARARTTPSRRMAVEGSSHHSDPLQHHALKRTRIVSGNSVHHRPCLTGTALEPAPPIDEVPHVSAGDPIGIVMGVSSHHKGDAQ